MAQSAPAATRVRVAAGRGRIDHRGQLRHADAGHHAGGADGARADADLDRVRPGVDHRLGAVAGGDIAAHHLGLV
jgi:hypothetical protein